MKMNRFLSLSATLATALLAAGCAAPGAGHNNPVDKVSNPNALAFTDANVADSGFTEVFVRDGALTEPNRFRSIVPGVPEAQAKTILGGEPVRESDGSRGHEWDYDFKFVLEPSKNFIVCQYKVVFDPAHLVREQVWRRQQCQLLAEAQAAPSPSPRPALSQ